MLVVQQNQPLQISTFLEYCRFLRGEACLENDAGYVFSHYILNVLCFNSFHIVYPFLICKDGYCHFNIYPVFDLFVLSIKPSPNFEYRLKKLQCVVIHTS